MPTAALFPRVVFPTDLLAAFSPAIAAPPTGRVDVLSGDLPSYTFRESDITLDLAGHKIGTVMFRDGIARVRLTNGKIGTFRNQVMNNATLPTRVTDVTIDHIEIVGGVTLKDRNSVRMGRLLISHCSSLAASGPTKLDGLHAYALWVDPGSHDVIVQDSQLWTRGAEACVRIEDTMRSAIFRCTLGCSGEKHAYRVHGHVGHPSMSINSWISDSVLMNRGMMIATLPDSTGPKFDAVKNTWVKRIEIRMLLDGHPSQAASFQFPASGTPNTPDGRPRLLNAVVEDVRVFGTAFNGLAASEAYGKSHPELHWSFARNTHTVTRAP